MRAMGVLSGGMVGAAAVALGGVCGSARGDVKALSKVMAGAMPALVAGFGAAESGRGASLEAMGARGVREGLSDDVASPGTAALVVLGGFVVMRRQRR